MWKWKVTHLILVDSPKFLPARHRAESGVTIYKRSRDRCCPINEWQSVIVQSRPASVWYRSASRRTPAGHISEAWSSVPDFGNARSALRGLLRYGVKNSNGGWNTYPIVRCLLHSRSDTKWGIACETWLEPSRMRFGKHFLADGTWIFVENGRYRGWLSRWKSLMGPMVGTLTITS